MAEQRLGKQRTHKVIGRVLDVEYIHRIGLKAHFFARKVIGVECAERCPVVVGAVVDVLVFGVVQRHIGVQIDKVFVFLIELVVDFPDHIMLVPGGRVGRQLTA